MARKKNLKLLKIKDKPTPYKKSRSDRLQFPTHAVGRLWAVLDTKMHVLLKKYPSICGRADIEAEVRLPDGRSGYIFYYGAYKIGSSGMPAHSKLALQRKEASLTERGYPYLKLKRTLVSDQIEIAVRRWLRTTRQVEEPHQVNPHQQ